MQNKLHHNAKEHADMILVDLNEAVGRGTGCGVVMGDVHPEGYLKMWDTRLPSRFGWGGLRLFGRDRIRVWKWLR